MIAAETLTTDRLILRRPAPADFEAYYAYAASPRTRFLGGPSARRRAFDRFANFAGHWLLRGYGRYIVTDRTTLRPLGHVGAFQHDDALPPEMAWSIWSDADSGKGLASEAASATLTHYREAKTWPLVCARIHRDNVASIAMARAFGGTLRADHDEPEVLRYDIDLCVQRACA